MNRLAATPLAALAIAVVAAACAQATGQVEGGDLLVVDPCATSAPTWTYLYTCLFGPTGKASCASLGSCHGGPQQSGALMSGYVCGTTKESCRDGMLYGEEAGLFAPIVCMQSLGCTSLPVSDPTKTTLWSSLHTASSKLQDNMPCGDPPVCHPDTATYTFTSDDLTQIETWIQQGAQDN